MKDAVKVVKADKLTVDKLTVDKLTGNELTTRWKFCSIEMVDILVVRRFRDFVQNPIFKILQNNGVILRFEYFSLNSSYLQHRYTTTLLHTNCSNHLLHLPLPRQPVIRLGLCDGVATTDCDWITQSYLGYMHNVLFMFYSGSTR